MSTNYKLTYFNARGRGEIIRLVLVTAGVPFEDTRIEHSEWLAKKPSLEKNLPFGQIPLLEFGDVKMCQSLAIARYLARKYNLAGKTDLDQARADMIVDCIEDTAKTIPAFAFAEQDPVKKEQMKKKYVEEQLPAFLDRLEALLVSNNGGNGYFVGDSLTWADLYMLQGYAWLELMVGLQSPLSKHPKLSALYQRILGHPKIAPYMAKIPKTPF
jgi:glutathione S-transferase